jgi:dipeptidyl aminopeptidase/acylaminoacyl peptidase
VRETAVNFFSEGDPIAGIWRTPETDGPFRAIVQGPGWLGLKDAKLYVRYHEALVAAGFGVLIIDYRGFGDSGGDRGVLSPARQLQDLVNAVTYLTTRDDVIADAIGTFGSGGTGGGNAILLAGADARVKAAVSQVPVSDGEDWLHRMRQEHEWLAFLASLEDDRRQRVLTGEGRLVHPREEIMVPTPERRTTTIKADVDDKIPNAISLSAAEEIIAYKPIVVARELTTPLMVIGVTGDATTPTDHAEALYEAARGPKSLIMQHHTTHYAAYDRYWEQTTPRIVAWFEQYVRPVDVAVRTTLPDVAGETTQNLEAPL